MTIPPITAIPVPDRPPLVVNQPFKNLEQRFNDALKGINSPYANANVKFDDGKESRGKFDQPFIQRNPGDSQKGIKTEGRSLPFVSTINDVKRLTKFQLSGAGIKFLLKQQLLQTGNTFAYTRIINPLFVVGNAVPFLHLRRQLKPFPPLGRPAIKGIKSSGATYVGWSTDLKKIGGVQQETWDKFKNNGKKGGFGSILKNSPIGKTISAFTAKYTANEALPWEESRPEAAGDSSKLAFITSRLYDYQERNIDAFTKNSVYKIRDYDAATKIEFPSDALGVIDTDVIPLKKYFTGDGWLNNITRQDLLGIGSPQAGAPNKEKNNFRYRAPLDADGNGVRMVKGSGPNGEISYIRDPANAPDFYNKVAVDIDKVAVPYTYLPVKRGESNSSGFPNNAMFDDPIIVSFAMGKDNHIQFRAFIKDLQQTANPEYKSYQYIGRIEKFVNYIGVQREISFKMDIIAFSKNELDLVWRRINYLTGMVFPYGYHRGIFQPNVVRLTLGNLFVNQPGYVTSFATNFNEHSWEIDGDKQIPMSTTADLKFVLIEKASKIAHSPFYGFTEKLPGFQTTIQGSALPAEQEIPADARNPIIPPTYQGDSGVDYMIDNVRARCLDNNGKIVPCK